jgi:gamma-glutamyl-gamma-aminobutyrate hydrolase PuuD
VVKAFVQDWGLDGIILSGGDNIGIYPVRDLTERTLMNRALATSAPLVGICRGCQLINDHLGGTLTNIKDHVATNHVIYIVEDMARLKQGDTIAVNSFHNKTILHASLAPELIATAVDEQANIGAFRHAKMPMYGIRWHPERNGPDEMAEFNLPYIGQCLQLDETGRY